MRPIVIAGPCTAESPELMDAVCGKLSGLSQELDFDFIFKASFDKANRTSMQSGRGPGLERALAWFEDVKRKHGVKALTDVHETWQVEPVAKVIDVLQIPAFLCRQTDLVAAAARSGRTVNIKKGQFMAPGAMASIVEKARQSARLARKGGDVWLTERGSSFGYGNLVVDMRAFPIMAQSGAPLIFDITHSTQLPAAGGEIGGHTSGGERRHAPVLARAATATGYLSGFFLEAHVEPAQAVSDKDAQLDLRQAETLLRQLIPLWKQAAEFTDSDREFRR